MSEVPCQDSPVDWSVMWLNLYQRYLAMTPQLTGVMWLYVRDTLLWWSDRFNYQWPGSSASRAPDKKFREPKFEFWSGKCIQGLLQILFTEHKTLYCVLVLLLNDIKTKISIVYLVYFSRKTIQLYLSPW